MAYGYPQAYHGNSGFRADTLLDVRLLQWGSRLIPSCHLNIVDNLNCAGSSRHPRGGAFMLADMRGTFPSYNAVRDLKAEAVFAYLRLRQLRLDGGFQLRVAHMLARLEVGRLGSACQSWNRKAKPHHQSGKQKDSNEFRHDLHLAAKEWRVGHIIRTCFYRTT